jgi:flagellar FliJ protein
MKRFVFGLESVLRWRRSLFEQQQSRLRALVAERDAIRLRLRELEEWRRRAERAVVDAPAVTGGELAALESYRRRLHAERARKQQELADCEARIEAQRQRVVEARRRVRLLERLKERRYAEWEAEALRELETLAAESYLARWKRG